ncbi:A disintegrin and metallopeptidase domain 3 [Microcebus murinus]|uniref:A disintegrin and metallopeptidase domain 3 n=1 Tax=Microcebus murinus TaxID=30608 RepID=UPI003F6C5747
MLSLLLVLAGLGRLSSGQHSETQFLQITVPQKIETNTSDGDVSGMHITYLIKIEGKTYTFHLEKQSFLHPRFLVYLYNKSGAMYPDSSFTKGHCFYQGYAAETPKSVATLSTCSGLRGMLQLKNISYGIEPLESSPTYAHILYQIMNNKVDEFSFQEKYSVTQDVDQPYRILVNSEKISGDALLKRTMKVHVIVDKSMYDYMGSEVAIAVEKVTQIFGFINTMFSQLKMTIMLSSLEVWSDQSKISTSGDVDELLQRFLSWKQKFSFQRFRDMAYLLIYRDHLIHVGATYHGMACDPKFAAGVALYSKRITLEAFSVVLVQLLGINLGLTYDNIYNCYCQGATCIMSPEAILLHGVKLFSSCSMDEFKQIISQSELECLQNETISRVISPKQSATCGNSVVESGEECDCGTEEKCTHKKCCNPKLCTLKKRAECGSGLCCNVNTCKIYDKGHLCRKKRDLCDLPEYCNGTSEFCVNDRHAADWEFCNEKSAYCYKGICRDSDLQCSNLFGKFAKGGPRLCIEEVNFQNDKFGNCGGRCSFRHVFCGKMVCHWSHSQIVPIIDHDVQYTYIEGFVCLSAHLRNSSRSDETYMKSGTFCGPYKGCIGRSCREVLHLRNWTLCDANNHCQGHGICNDVLNCHCDAGYFPPKCDLDPQSPGGSIDDGNWSPGGRKMPLLVKRPQKNGLLISFYVFLPFLILTAIIGLKWKKMKEFWHRAETASTGSFSEVSNSNSSQS